MFVYNSVKFSVTDVWGSKTFWNTCSQETRILQWAIGKKETFHPEWWWPASVAHSARSLSSSLALLAQQSWHHCCQWLSSPVWDKMVPPLGPLVTLGLLEYLICSWKVLIFFLGESRAENSVLCTPPFLPCICCSLAESTRSDLCLRIVNPGANLIKQGGLQSSSSIVSGYLLM